MVGNPQKEKKNSNEEGGIYTGPINYLNRRELCGESDNTQNPIALQVEVRYR